MIVVNRGINTKSEIPTPAPIFIISIWCSQCAPSYIGEMKTQAGYAFGLQEVPELPVACQFNSPSRSDLTSLPLASYTVPLQLNTSTFDLVQI